MSIKLEVGKKYVFREPLRVEYVIPKASIGGRITELDLKYKGIDTLVYHIDLFSWWDSDTGLHASSDPGLDLVAEYQDNNLYPLAENTFAGLQKVPIKFGHTCVAVDTGFKKTWCKICEQDMEY